MQFVLFLNDLACSKRSDSGERRELGKQVKKRGEPIFLYLIRLLSFAPLPYSSRLSPLSERLEQTINELFFWCCRGSVSLHNKKEDYGRPMTPDE